MKLIDLHADTMLEMYLNDITDLRENTLQVDIGKMIKGNSFVQCLALYNEYGKTYDEMMDFYDFYRDTVNKYQEELAIVRKSEDIEKNMKDGKISILMSVEDLGPLEGRLERIKDLYDKNIRMMSLTWNYENSFGFPNSEDAAVMNKGLKRAGIEAVNLMDELGIIIDISHLSDGGVYDVFRYCKNPIIASHSNSRRLASHPRNITDDMVRKIAESGGIIGLNFCGDFLGDDHASSVKNMIRNIKHITNIGGMEAMGIGSDFDGDIDDGNLEIQNIGQIEKLEAGLRREGFSEDDIEKIFFKNALRVLREVL